MTKTHKSIAAALTLGAAAVGAGLGLQQPAAPEALAISDNVQASFLRANINNKFVSSENGSNNGMNCNRNSAGSWELFSVELVDGEWSLCGNNKKFVSSENGNRSMRCNRNGVGAWEKFELVSLPDRAYALKGNNGKFVSSEDGRQPMRCNRNGIGTWETFFVSNF